MKCLPYVIASTPFAGILFGLCLVAAGTPQATPFDRVMDGIKGDYEKRVAAAGDLYDKRYKSQVEPVLKRIQTSRDKSVIEATKSAKARLKAAAANCRKLGDEVSAALYEQEAEQLKMPVIEKTEKSVKFDAVGTWKVEYTKGFKPYIWVINPDGTIIGGGSLKGTWRVTDRELKIVWANGKTITLFQPTNSLVGKGDGGLLLATRR